MRALNSWRASDLLNFSLRRFIKQQKKKTTKFGNRRTNVVKNRKKKKKTNLNVQKDHKIGPSLLTPPQGEFHERYHIF